MSPDADQIDEGVASKFVGQLPGRRLVEPHQWRLDSEWPVHPKAQRHLSCPNRVVATVRVPGEVRLAHTSNKIGKSSPVANCARQCEKHQIAAGNERVWKASGIERDGRI